MVQGNSYFVALPLKVRGRKAMGCLPGLPEKKVPIICWDLTLASSSFFLAEDTFLSILFQQHRNSGILLSSCFDYLIENLLFFTSKGVNCLIQLITQRAYLLLTNLETIYQTLILPVLFQHCAGQISLLNYQWHFSLSALGRSLPIFASGFSGLELFALYKDTT